jgi:predicted glycosyltransferase
VPEQVTFVQLAPVSTRGGDFSTLLDANDQPISESLLEARAAALIATLHDVQPDILITELFPFGRRVLADEFVALLREARKLRQRPLVLSSIRDILVAPAKAGRVAETAGRLGEFYDAVLVHGDPSLASLDLSWPVDDRLRLLLRYTGYVDEAHSPVAAAQRAGIVVSGGSSGTSLPLYRAALEAARFLDDRSWRILVGQGVGGEAFRALEQDAPSNVVIERTRADFRQLLAAAELSVSQSGYNTCVDILRSGVRSILVPFEAGRETEQRLRAGCLQRAGHAEVLREELLDGRSLAEAVAATMRNPLPPPPSFRLDGARETVRIAEELSLPRPALGRASVDWTPFESALGYARDRGYEPVLWWRDDDAVEATPQLDRLLRQVRAAKADIALAVVPTHARKSLADRLGEESGACVLVHGYAHVNHASAGEKKAEFGPGRDVAGMAAETRAGLQELEKTFRDNLLRVFVPPWNRVARPLVPLLAEVGYTGLSTFRDRLSAHPAPGLLQINTHVDPIDWHGGRGLQNVSAVVAAFADALRTRGNFEGPIEPIGFLTHHLVHDKAVWSFCEELLAFMARNNLHFAPVRKLFCDKIGNVVEP